MSAIGISLFRDGKISNKDIASGVWNKSIHETLHKQWKEAYAAHTSITEQFTYTGYLKSPAPKEYASEVTFGIFALYLRLA